VCAALAFQNENTTCNQKLSDDIRPEVRVGISLGEVVVAHGTITGAGIVLAQRLEQLAEPRGVVVQGAVSETVPTRLPFDFESLGEQALKGLDQPVKAFIARQKPEALIPEPESPIADAGPGGVAADTIEERPLLDFSDKPSIAVLPFTNMSGDPEQTYFSDGITEDIITELSRFHSLFVIARNSSFSFRDRNVNATEVGRQLNVQYVVEGSVRKSGNTVRVTVQLIEAASAHHLWAERYDRELEDIFAVQDEITQTIVATLPGRLEDAGRQNATRKPTGSLTAYDYLLIGLERFNRFTREQNAEARELFQKAVEVDPQYVRARTLLASTYVWEVMMESSGHKQLDKAFAGVEEALSLDDNDAWTHAAFGFLLFFRGEDEDAETHFRRAVALNPNDADAAAFMCNFLVYIGRWEEGLEWIALAKRLNPVPPAIYHWYHALALYSAREYAQAVKTIKKMRPLLRWGRGYLAACYAHMNRMDSAHAEIEAFVKASQRELKERGEPARPVNLSLASERAERYRNSSDREHFIYGLRKAGLPE
jgi:TolB-like protein/Tfp pilus assembly protein PilF